MIVSCNLLINRYAFSLQVFIDSGTNGFVFIDQTIIID
jgi:hypothetical protein